MPQCVLIEINVSNGNTPIVIAAVVRGWDEAMATAAHYRKLAEECFQWAHEARDMSVRQHYAKLCQIWLECAARAELRSGALTPPETTHKAA